MATRPYDAGKKRRRSEAAPSIVDCVEEIPALRLPAGFLAATPHKEAQQTQTDAKQAEFGGFGDCRRRLADQRTVALDRVGADVIQVGGGRCPTPVGRERLE